MSTIYEKLSWLAGQGITFVFRGELDAPELPVDKQVGHTYIWKEGLWFVDSDSSWVEIIIPEELQQAPPLFPTWEGNELPPSNTYDEYYSVVWKDSIWMVHQDRWVEIGTFSALCRRSVEEIIPDSVREVIRDQSVFDEQQKNYAAQPAFVQAIWADRVHELYTHLATALHQLSTRNRYDMTKRLADWESVSPRIRETHRFENLEDILSEYHLRVIGQNHPQYVPIIQHLYDNASNELPINPYGLWTKAHTWFMERCDINPEWCNTVVSENEQLFVRKAYQNLKHVCYRPLPKIAEPGFDFVEFGVTVGSQNIPPKR